MYKNLVHTNVYEYNVQTTYTFDNRLHRAGVPRLGRGSYHGEPTPLTLASRGGSVGPLFHPGECSTAPDPSGEYDETRGSRPQDVGVSSLRPHSQRSAETHDDDRRRAAISRACQSSKCNYLEPTRLKTVRSGRPKPSNNEVRGRTNHEKTIPAEPTGRPLSGGRENEGGSTPPPKMRLHDRQRRAKRLVGLRPIATCLTHTQMGGHHVCMRCNAMQSDFQLPDD